jgi:polysaccharide biosynthesis/export protein
MKSSFTSLAALLGLLILTSCGGNVVTKPGKHTQLSDDATVVTNADYLIGAGDEIEIKFFFTPELNDRVVVRPDGNISIMFADDVKVAGKTTKQLTKIVKQKLAPHVKQLDLSVVVRSFGSQRVFIGGEVAKPGAVTLVGHQTLLQVLNEAGWVNPEGRMSEVVLIRRNAAGVEEVYPLNIAKIISGEDVSQNVVVMAGDTILVPPYGAVDLNRWMERNVRGALPFSMGAVVNRGVGPR